MIVASRNEFAVVITSSIRAGVKYVHSLCLRNKIWIAKTYSPNQTIFVFVYSEPILKKPFKKAAVTFKDNQIAEEKHLWRIRGGCAAIAALFFLGKVYVANAGDCRGLLVANSYVQQLSQDFTPDFERKRLQYLVIFTVIS